MAEDHVKYVPDMLDRALIANLRTDGRVSLSKLVSVRAARRRTASTGWWRQAPCSIVGVRDDYEANAIRGVASRQLRSFASCAGCLKSRHFIRPTATGILSQDH
jgi:hypothetical protein